MRYAENTGRCAASPASACVIGRMPTGMTVYLLDPAKPAICESRVHNVYMAGFQIGDDGIGFQLQRLNDVVGFLPRIAFGIIEFFGPGIGVAKPVIGGVMRLGDAWHGRKCQTCSGQQHVCEHSVFYSLYSARVKRLYFKSKCRML